MNLKVITFWDHDSRIRTFKGLKLTLQSSQHDPIARFSMLASNYVHVTIRMYNPTLRSKKRGMPNDNFQFSFNQQVWISAAYDSWRVLELNDKYCSIGNSWRLRSLIWLAVGVDCVYITLNSNSSWISFNCYHVNDLSNGFGSHAGPRFFEVINNVK